jgi:hypothetical protein
MEFWKSQLSDTLNWLKKNYKLYNMDLNVLWMMGLYNLFLLY